MALEGEGVEQSLYTFDIMINIVRSAKFN